MAYTHRFITTLGLTAFVETAVLFFLFRYVLRDRAYSNAQILFAGLFASFATIAYVWYVFPNVIKWPRQTSLMWSEPFVAIVEAIFYRMYFRVNWWKAFFLSFVCNASSFYLDIILRSWGIWIYW